MGMGASPVTPEALGEHSIAHKGLHRLAFG